MLLADGALSQCCSLLVSLGGAVAEGNKEEGMELVRKLMDQIWYFITFVAFQCSFFVVVVCSVVFTFLKQIMCTNTLNYC